MSATGTLGQHLALISPRAPKRKTPLPWPPDVFAIAASLLLESAAYIRLVEDWPPAGDVDEASRLDCFPEDWSWDLLGVAEEWRDLWSDDQSRTTPRKVRDWWQVVRDRLDRPMTRVSDDPSLCSALFHLLAAADEASRDAGLPIGAEDFFLSLATVHLLSEGELGSSLCSPAINPLKARVLPKQHTPRTGITLRSLSHHLALCELPDVRTAWTMAPALPGSLTIPEPDEEVLPGTENEPSQSLQLLLVPHPSRLQPRQFRPAEPSKGRLSNMPKEYGFFRYDIDADPEARQEEIDHYLREAEKLCDHVDGIVYPELALSAEEFQGLHDHLAERETFVIAGVGESSQGADPGSNYVHIHIPVLGSFIPLRQDKHHRWCLDRSQIETYGLDGFLSPARSWWEHTSVEPRNLSFISLNDWLTFCVLICEDLARQDPVARIVRAVGANLVIALLMDGPQLANRWPARYATVLAEDPGSSVLTLTSVGMAERSRPPGRPDLPISRVVALWKDAESGTREIELPRGSGALLLTLIPRFEEEWTADGRSDYRSASHPVLAGVHPLPEVKSDQQGVDA